MLELFFQFNEMFIDSDSDSSTGNSGTKVSTLDAIYLSTLFQENDAGGTENDLIETEKLLKGKSTAEKLLKIFNLTNPEELVRGKFSNKFNL